MKEIIINFLVFLICDCSLIKDLKKTFNEVQTVLGTEVENVISEAKENLILFENFEKQFKKSYENDDARAKALINILSNKRQIEKHNQQFLLGLRSYKRGIWEYSDMSAQEITETMTGFVRRAKQKSLYEFEYPREVPDYLNYTEKGWVSRVMNQGLCGACWAFSAIGAWEGQNAKKNGKLVKLSEQNLIDCNKNEISGNWGCRGGDMKNVYEFILSKDQGINAGSYYRYKGRGNYNCAYSSRNSVATLKDYVEVETGNETLLMEALSHVGPLAVAIDASLESLQSYCGGVYDDPECTDQINHAVVLVGYGTDPLGGDYWLLKNSWGSSFGENGYIRIARNRDNLCGVASEITYPVI